MILVLFIGLLMTGGLMAWISSRWSDLLARWISLVVCTVNLVLILILWFRYYPGIDPVSNGNWMVEFRAPWIPRFGVEFHLALDGLSLLMLALTFFLGWISVLVSWKQIRQRAGFYHFNLLWILAGITGVFLSMDLFLFY